MAIQTYKMGRSRLSLGGGGLNSARKLTASMLNVTSCSNAWVKDRSGAVASSVSDVSCLGSCKSRSQKIQGGF